MKLEELFEAISIEPKEPKGQFKVSPALKRQELGSGIEAYVYKNKVPNSVIKVATIDDIKNNPYIKFLNLIKNHQDNPFFPRIYSAKIFKNTAKDNYNVVVNMEKLVPLKNQKIIDMIPYLLKQIGISKEDAENTLTNAGWDETGINHIPVYSAFRDPEKREKLIKNSKNPVFIEAMNILKPLFDSHAADLHLDNIMARLTSHGPQLVITDPFYE